MGELNEELKKFIGKEILVDLIGRNFAPKGVLIRVENDFLILNETRILLGSITSFKLAKKRANIDGKIAQS